MSRLLCVVAAMLLVTAAMAVPGDFAETTDNVPAGLPISATATFKATVETYASVSVTPPTDLTILGDVDGDPGSGTIEPDLTTDPVSGLPTGTWNPTADVHGGLVEVSANDKCYLQMQVTEFNNDPGELTGERLWSLVKVGTIAGSLAPAGSGADFWLPLLSSQTNLGAVGTDWVQIIDGVGGWDPDANAGLGAPIGTMLPEDTVDGNGPTYVISNLLIDPLSTNKDYDFRYLRVFWGTKAYNRIDADAPTDTSHVYETLAAKGDYVATVTATLTADAL